ncbi:hypothetical protein [Rouxiella sp. Mn2063]|uniref:hypothetical protein n=1 Tax=Rouxiella sp. Mn2063 TaxID=3395262 RepID=UPI003BD237D5
MDSYGWLVVISRILSPYPYNQATVVEVVAQLSGSGGIMDAFYTLRALALSTASVPLDNISN